MQNLLVNPTLSDDARRRALFDGDLIFYIASAASVALCEHAVTMIKEAFAPHDPEHAQEVLPVEKFVEIVGPLKSRFTNDQRTKELLRDYFSEKGIENEQNLF